MKIKSIEDFLGKIKLEKFWGEIQINFQNGKINHIKKIESFQVENILDSIDKDIEK